jgi:hypothetical protein
VNALTHFKSAWLDEYRLIRNIWNGSFPEQGAGPPISLSILEKSWMTTIVFIRSLSFVQIQNFFQSYKIQSEISEFYVLAWLFLLLWLLWNPLTPLASVFAIVIYRMVDAFNYRLCILFVDRYKRNWGLRSLGRSLILILINYLEIIVGFGILYLNTGSIEISTRPGKLLGSPIEALYYSTVTITTLGYGDFTPSNDTGRILVMLELLLGFIFVALVIGLLLTGARFVRELRPTTKGSS